MGYISTFQDTGVSIITCTNKPQFIKNIFENYERQVINKKELIIVINNDRMNLVSFKKMARKYKNVWLYKLPGKTSLGGCLNFAAKKAKYPYISKFDDDDYYAPKYLTDVLSTFQRIEADIIGKRTVFAYLDKRKLLIIRFPNNENKYSQRIAGGTITFKRNVFNFVKFRDITIGEDVAFFKDCLQKGFKIYSSSKYNYVYIRRNNHQHTWKTNDHYLLKGSKIITRTQNFVPWIIKRQ